MIEQTFGSVSQSDIVWKVLKSALAQVTRERPFRGPQRYAHPPYPDFMYHSSETRGETLSCRGEEEISFKNHTLFLGRYDFVLVKKNLEDLLPQ